MSGPTDRRDPAVADTTSGPVTRGYDSTLPTGWIAESVGPAEPVGTPRFAQLTYTSFDPGGGQRGGWQVRQADGDVTADEEAFLVKGVPTQFATGIAVPRLPRPEQIEALPRKLVHAPFGTASAYWHTAPAGADGTGRPGNVFCHVVLDREPGTSGDPMRSSDLLDSPHWLRPFNAERVLAADLTTVPPLPWPPRIGGEAAVDFLLRQVDEQPGVLAGLLDAVAAAMETRDAPTVVLGTDVPGHAELWIAAVAHLMSAGTSRRFHWSTDERAAGLAVARRRDLHLVVVPSSEAATVTGDGGFVVVHDDPDAVDGQPVELGDLNSSEPHRTRAGAAIEVTPWSVLAAEVLQDGSLARDVLRLRDEVAWRLGDCDLTCAWPLAMAVALRSDDLAQAQDEAAEVLTGGPGPAALAGVPEYRSRIRALITRSLGTTAEDALPFAEGRAADDARRVPRIRALSVYLERAMEDPAWLARPDHVPFPQIHDVQQLSPDLLDVAARAVRARPPELASAPELSALVAVRLALLVHTYNLPLVGDRRVDPGGRVGRELRQDVAALVGQVVVPVLTDPLRGPELVARVGRVPETFAREVLRRPVGDALPAIGHRRPGERLVPAVLRWLYPKPPSAPPPGAGDGDPLLVELARQVTDVVPDPSEFRRIAVMSMLADRDVPADQVAGLAESHPWTVREIASAATSGVDPGPVVPVLVSALLSAPWDDDLVHALRAMRVDESVRPVEAAAGELWNAARLRWLARSWWEYRPDAADGLVELLALGESPAGGLPATTADDVLVALRAARLCELVRSAADRPDALDVVGHPRPSLDRRLDDEPVSDAVVHELGRALDQGVLDDATLVFAAFCGAPELAGVPPELEHLRRLQELTVAVPGPGPGQGPGQWPEAEPVLERVLRERLGLRGGRSAQSLLDDAMIRMEAVLRMSPPADPSVRPDVDRAVQAWSRRLRDTNDDSSHWRRQWRR